MDGLNIFQSPHFTVAHGASPTVPGYLIVTTRGGEKSLSAMKPEAQTELGVVLAKATRLIEETVRPERVYCARFGEEVETIHFHLFPRTREMMDAYRKTGGPVNALLIFEWCRKNLGVDADSPAVRDVIERMRRLARES
jgi:diadenosine tetraphosphate (Ap4A) HIT family hydrolase